MHVAGQVATKVQQQQAPLRLLPLLHPLLASHRPSPSAKQAVLLPCGMVKPAAARAVPRCLAVSHPGPCLRTHGPSTGASQGTGAVAAGRHTSGSRSSAGEQCVVSSLLRWRSSLRARMWHGHLAVGTATQSLKGVQRVRSAVVSSYLLTLHNVLLVTRIIVL